MKDALLSFGRSAIKGTLLVMKASFGFAVAPAIEAHTGVPAQVAGLVAAGVAKFVYDQFKHRVPGFGWLP